MLPRKITRKHGYIVVAIIAAISYFFSSYFWIIAVTIVFVLSDEFEKIVLNEDKEHL